MMKKSKVGYIFEIDVKYPKKLYELQDDLPFLPERKKLGKVEKLVTNLQNISEIVINIKSLKQVLNRDLILKKVLRVISFNQDEWLKPCIEMNNKLKTEAKNDFERDFFKLMNNAVLLKQWRIWENIEILNL